MGTVLGELLFREHNDGVQFSSDKGATWTDVGSSNSGGGTFAAVLARAQALLGPTITKAFGTDFDTTLWTGAAVVANGGTGLLSTTELGGVIELKSNGLANAIVSVRPAGTAGLITNLTTNLWYQRCRFRLTTAPNANTYTTIAVSGIGTSVGLFFGAPGNVSTTHFAYDFYNNAGAPTSSGSLGVPFDTNWHIAELLGDGSFFDIYMDGTRRLHLAIPAATSNAACTRLDAANGATPANQQMNVDDLVICTAG